MNTQHAVITGGAAGLGLGAATQLLQRGFAVTLVDINAEALANTARGLQQRFGEALVRGEQADLSDPASIAALVARLRARGDAIDVLVNNAGIYPPSQRRTNGEGQELSFAIGHLGHFRLTHGLWPLLEAAPAARVVSTSSLVQRFAQLHLDDLPLAHNYKPITAYRQTKLACLMFALELQRHCARAGSSISSYAAHPGVCRTQIGANRPMGAHDSLFQRISSFGLRYGMTLYGRTPEDGAYSIVLAATSNDFAAGSFIGPHGLLDITGEHGLVKPGRAASNPELCAQLWQQTEQLTGLTWPI